MANWKVGDQVVLKSGGPVMTVNSAFGDTVNCAWFAGKKREQGTFGNESLKPAPEQPDEEG